MPEMPEMPDSSYEILKEVDISPHVEKKGNYDYVSWASALDILYSNFPKASYEVHTCQEGHPFFKSELGYYVVVSVTIGDKTETEYYPVTGNNNKPISKPTMVDINNSIKRGLAKTIAQHGLGLELWIGEDLEQYGAGTESGDDKPVRKPSTKPSNNGQQVSPEVQAEWDKIVREAKSTWAGMAVGAKDKDGNDVTDRPAWKQEVQDKFVALYSESNGFNFYANTWKDLSRAELDVAYKSLFPSLVDEE